MSEKSTCPHCGAAIKPDNFYYECLSTVIEYQSGLCVRYQRDQLLQKVQWLEVARDHAEDAASALLRENRELCEKVQRLSESQQAAIHDLIKGDNEKI